MLREETEKAVFLHTQPELSCDGWADGVDLVQLNLNKTKEYPQKNKGMFTRCVLWASLTFTVGISDVPLAETGNSYTTKGKWPLNKLHSSPHVCLCLYE